MERVSTISFLEPPEVMGRVDYVVVVDRNIKKLQFYNDVMKFFNFLQVRGIRVELGFGNIKENIYVKLHITDEAVRNFASVYDVDIEVDHHFIPISAMNLKIAQTPVTLNQDIFRRKGGATNTERILILYGLLSEARFGDSDEDNKYGINKLQSIGAAKAVYPLHDGPHELEDTTDDFLNDRQKLLKYWASFSMWYKEQPLNLIEQYFGTEVAFYFAWLGFYNMMLIPASIVGFICFVISIVDLNVGHQEILEEICNSELLMCPRCTFGRSCIAQPLKNDCPITKVFVIFDNYATVFFAIFMSFWATAFMSLWKRFENVLKIRWNVTAASMQAKTQTRLPFKEKARRKRISEVTGKMEHYTPAGIQCFSYVLSYGACLLLVGIVLLVIIGVTLYKIAMSALIRMSSSSFLNLYAPFIEAITSSVLQVIFIKIYGKFYAPMSEWLTNMENPRTQFEFDKSVVHKRYILGFANNYASLIYISFVKGRTFWPGHMEVGSLRTDLCHTCGCIVLLCIQLFVLMLLKSMAGNILTLIVPKITRRFSKKTVSESTSPQWEEEFQLYPAGRYLLTTEFMEMIIQYGFVTFFVAAFPLAPLCALINNTMELRLDAYKLVTRYRRPVPKKESGIGSWGDILIVITHLSVATNAFVLSFTSDFVAREIYKFQHDQSLKGYVESTLSIYDMEPDIKHGSNKLVGLRPNSTLCYYKGQRYPPDHPDEYHLTSKFWYETGMRLICVIIFEHFIMLTNGIVAYFIPDTPYKIEQAVDYERTRPIDSALDEIHEKINQIPRRRRKPKLHIDRN